MSINNSNNSIEKKIHALFEIKNNSDKKTHSFSYDRFSHLSNWIDKKQHRYDFVKENWNHPKFFPHISQADAEKLCHQNHIFIVRLSNSRPGVVSMSHPKNNEGVRSTICHMLTKKKNSYTKIKS